MVKLSLEEVIAGKNGPWEKTILPTMISMN